MNALRALILISFALPALIAASQVAEAASAAQINADLLQWLDAHPDNLAAFANADGTDTANKAAFALQSPEIQAWSPESDHGATTVEVDTEWYMGAGEIKDRIDAFWKSYIN